jgi:eukaryotic-like serine/threonine-protein kinase
VNRWDLTDPARPVPLAPRRTPFGRAFATAFSHNGRLLAASSLTGVSVWYTGDDPDTEPIANLERDTLPGPTRALAFHPAAPVLVSGDISGGVAFWDLADPVRPRLMLETKTIRGAVTTAAFSPDGDRLALGGMNKQLHVGTVTV